MRGRGSRPWCAAAALPGAAVELQRRTGAGWVTIKHAPANALGAVAIGYRPQRLSGRYQLRPVSGAETLPT